MKTDRELLELAAKAAGYALKWHTKVDVGMIDQCLMDLPPEAHHFRFTKHPYNEWSPLTDDGDALRLAVKMGISLEIDSIHCDDPQVAAIAYGDVLYRAYFESDPYAATRRAIVRAAAAIGESMP